MWTKTNNNCQGIHLDFKEIDEMIATVDKNEDWKISYSEFRVRFCGKKVAIFSTVFSFTNFFPRAKKSNLLQTNYAWF